MFSVAVGSQDGNSGLDEEDDVGDNRGDMPAEKIGSILTRRRILQGVAGFIAAAAFPAKWAAASVLRLSQGSQGASPTAAADLTGRFRLREPGK